MFSNTIRRCLAPELESMRKRSSEQIEKLKINNQNENLKNKFHGRHAIKIPGRMSPPLSHPLLPAATRSRRNFDISLQELGDQVRTRPKHTSCLLLPSCVSLDYIDI
ncbi:hypothetical protein TNCT_224031 [Trichonephila clavata]|uniref:Uncharacterized protein n=1 Tax=Trichonephila clavata TaxID=2740835 RepID=A0A8X6IFW6_TRICU|nr:hypothetical protein TNCT_224031 [Trichonephila clavata]